MKTTLYASLILALAFSIVYTLTDDINEEEEMHLFFDENDPRGIPRYYFANTRQYPRRNSNRIDPHDASRRA